MISAVALADSGEEGVASAVQPSSSAGVSYTHEVRPILSANCFSCHGRDDEGRQADLRLDQRAAAVEYGAIVPGDPRSSLLAERITSDDPDMKMPPPDTGHRLNNEQIEILQRWIAEGANYEEHWSFVAPTRPSPPAVNTTGWPSNEIDYFILHRLEEIGLKPAREADPYSLVRRVFLDLTGVPPSPELADRFVASPSEAAYAQLVDELLASPQFGEHWARVWLDLARYADTKGYEKDLPRDMWPYRDWVVRAINDDMPYNQFTIEQVAGDLLPNPTREQLIATAFHRNTMSNDEGGTDDEEFRVAAVKDRVDTTMQVWMGITAGCAKCHTHKYDPISHEEYYQLFAIFNQTADNDAHDDVPVLRFESAAQAESIAAVRQEIDTLKKKRTSRAADAPKLDTEIAAKEKQLNNLESSITKLPIMCELDKEKQRTTKTHLRGNFLELGAEVSPAVPAAFGRMDPHGPQDRLGLAKWLMSDKNPLSARVAANRIWARFFGIGIVESEGDFGSQGSPPSHPRLLDWLATELRDTHDWSLKKTCKTIVMSSAYRQASNVDPAKLEADPRNRLLGRGPRLRLPAETVRDQALSAAGLLSQKMFGAPAMPPQPPGVWKTIYNARNWQTSTGDDRYRRGIYTYWKRTSPYPAMIIFDAESREVCAIRRITSSTPLQALVLLNDPVYLEASAALARRMISEVPATAQDRIARGFRLLMIRPPAPEEIGRLDQLRVAAETKFRADPTSAALFLEACNAHDEMAVSSSPHEFAAYTVVASALINLDESITRN
jgi:hypothetical protein